MLHSSPCCSEWNGPLATHVIRGEEWLPSTPKHALLYSSFNWDPPRFAHLPLLLNPDRSKMSKRRMQDGKQVDVFVEEYRRRGYLPEALLNYLARLGWGHGDDEKFSMQQFIEWFDASNVSHSPARFDQEILSWLNQQYLK